MGSFILPIIFIIFAIIASIWAVKTKPKVRKSSTAFYKKTPLNSAIDKHNECISRLNRLSEEANEVFLKKRCEIVMKQDKSASMALNDIMDSLNNLIENASYYIRSSSENIDNQSAIGSEYCLKNAEPVLLEIKDMITAIKRLPVTDTYANVFENMAEHKPTVSKATNGSLDGLFSGCKTKEEVDARYRHLAKAFHPDNTGGDKTMFENLQKQYQEAKKL